MCVCRFKNGKLISRRPEFSRFKVLNQALEIRDVCKQDAGEYTVIVKNTAAALEKRLNYTLIVNGNLILIDFIFVSSIAVMSVNLLVHASI